LAVALTSGAARALSTDKSFFNYCKKRDRKSESGVKIKVGTPIGTAAVYLPSLAARSLRSTSADPNKRWRAMKVSSLKNTRRSHL
jgi:hypothetical protein